MTCSAARRNRAGECHRRTPALRDAQQFVTICDSRRRHPNGDAQSPGRSNIGTLAHASRPILPSFAAASHQHKAGWTMSPRLDLCFDRQTAHVVDDDSRIRQMISRYLDEEGFAVELAENGAAMWACLERQRVDLVLLDLVLPGGGRPVAREIRSRFRRYRHHHGDRAIRHGRHGGPRGRSRRLHFEAVPPSGDPRLQERSSPRAAYVRRIRRGDPVRRMVLEFPGAELKAPDGKEVPLTSASSTFSSRLRSTPGACSTGHADGPDARTAVGGVRPDDRRSGGAASTQDRARSEEPDDDQSVRGVGYVFSPRSNATTSARSQPYASKEWVGRIRMSGRIGGH